MFKKLSYFMTLRQKNGNSVVLCIAFYFISSSEINAYQKQIKVISITSEMIRYQSLVMDISLYFHCSVFLDYL